MLRETESSSASLLQKGWFPVRAGDDNQFLLSLPGNAMSAHLLVHCDIHFFLRMWACCVDACQAVSLSCSEISLPGGIQVVSHTCTNQQRPENSASSSSSRWASSRLSGLLGRSAFPLCSCVPFSGGKWCDWSLNLDRRKQETTVWRLRGMRRRVLRERGRERERERRRRGGDRYSSSRLGLWFVTQTQPEVALSSSPACNALMVHNS